MDHCKLIPNIARSKLILHILSLCFSFLFIHVTCDSIRKRKLGIFTLNAVIFNEYKPEAFNIYVSYVIMEFFFLVLQYK